MKFKKAKNVYIFYATKRSGHHGIIDWIRFSYRGDTLFMNDPVIYGNPFDTCKKYHLNDRIYPKTVPKSSLDAEWNALAKSPEKDLPDSFESVFFNYENFNFKNYDARKIKEVLRGCFEEFTNVYEIIVLRDYYNTQASEYKNNKTINYTSKTVWNELAKRFSEDNRFIPINYNKWCLDSFYRQYLASELDLPNPAEKNERVSTHGGGSSFNNGLRNINEVGNTLKRYETVPREEMEEVLKDEDMQRVNESIFGEDFVEEIRRWVKNG